MTRSKRAIEAAAALRECRAALAARGSTVVREAAGDVGCDIADWQHYPAGEVYDSASHAQYFFHCHGGPAGSRPSPPDGFGHFHVFLRGEGIPAGLAPLLFAEIAVANAPPPPQSAPLKRGSRDEICHLVAISVDRHGEPIRLFATNRWVTGETWYRADDVIAMLDRVRFGAVGAPPSLLSRWIEALVRLFQPDIAALLRQRDKAITEWRWRWPRSNVFEDPRLEVTASCAIDLEARLATVEGRGTEVTAMRGPGRRGRLPSMAEGWGA